jgi:hypothetical protein
MEVCWAERKATVRISSLILATMALGFLLPEPAVADKMRPGMSHKNRFGLNAMTHCRRPRVSVCQGCSVSIKMRVPQNGICPLNFKSLGPFAGQDILVRPQNGVYGSASETATAYRPNPGFLGKDHFETRLYFEEGSGKRTVMFLKVNAFVVPSI